MNHEPHGTYVRNPANKKQKRNPSCTSCGRPNHPRASRFVRDRALVCSRADTKYLCSKENIKKERKKNLIHRSGGEIIYPHVGCLLARVNHERIFLISPQKNGATQKKKYKSLPKPDASYEIGRFLAGRVEAHRTHSKTPSGQTTGASRREGALGR